MEVLNLNLELTEVIRVLWNNDTSEIASSMTFFHSVKISAHRYLGRCNVVVTF
jgi:hypothetical protein